MFNHTELDLSVNRLCWQLIENHSDFSDTVLIGMQPRGYQLAQKIHSKLIELSSVSNIFLGSLDITFFRDDFRRREAPISPNQTDIDFLVEGKRWFLLTMCFIPAEVFVPAWMPLILLVDQNKSNCWFL